MEQVKIIEKKAFEPIFKLVIDIVQRYLNPPKLGNDEECFQLMKDYALMIQLTTTFEQVEIGINHELSFKLLNNLKELMKIWMDPLRISQPLTINQQ